MPPRVLTKHDYRVGMRFRTTILQTGPAAMGLVVPEEPETRARRIERSIASLREGRIW